MSFAKMAIRAFVIGLFLIPVIVACGNEAQQASPNPDDTTAPANAHLGQFRPAVGVPPHAESSAYIGLGAQ